ncbi:MAG: hypothetical protein U0Q16_39305 [Bryobacteraceae bacterium]
MAGWVEELYLRLPVGRDLAATVKGLLLKRQRYGPHFHDALPGIRERDQWTRSRLDEYQAERLVHLLGVASRTRYYRRVFEQHGIDPATIRTPADLRRLPILEKDDLRRQPLDLVDERFDPARLIEDRSSGTTGTPVRLFVSRSTLQTHFAYFEVRSRAATGLHFGELPYVMFGARRVVPLDRDRPPFWCYNHASRQLYMSAYHLGARYLDHYCQELRRRRYHALMGYPSVISTVARHILDNGIRDIRIPVTITQGEMMSPRQRMDIEAAFQSRVFEQYGCSEICVFAQECARGKMHASIDYGLLEILDDSGNPAAPGVTGHVVCTGLVNDAQPLIRYRLGDMAAWSVRGCDCGSAMPVLAAIEGRTANAIVLPDGRRVYRVTTIAENIPAIQECQIVQQDLHRFTILVAAGPSFTPADSEQLRTNLADCVGHAAEIRVDRCERIPRGPNGKFAFIVSKVTASRPE